MEVKRNNQLGLRELVSLAIGGVVGVGAITHIGVAIGYTGPSAWLAYITAVLIGMLFCLPIGIATSVLRLDGGIYTLIGHFMGKQAAGIYAAGFLLYFPGIAIYGMSIGMYLHSMWPSINQKAAGIGILTLFYLINLSGVKLMVKAQKVMVVSLLTSLLVFIAVGLPQITSASFAFGSSDFFMNGAGGFFRAVFLLFYSVTGYYWIMFYGRYARHPQKNIPTAMLITALSILVLYGGIGLVESGVLPVEQVANQPLTWVAKEILPQPLFLAFMICGPFMALMAPANFLFTTYCQPVREAAEDGWFASAFAKTNNRGVSVLPLTLLWLCGIAPIFLGMDIATITNSYMLVDYTLIYLMMFSLLRIPSKMPQQWDKRYIRIPTKLYYVCTGVAILIQTATIIAAASSLTATMLISSLTILFILIVYALLRGRSGKVHMAIKKFD
ncbi:MAG: APC family permease [Clostridiaceae bacterium]|nr:APC family permease [Clostridiaceae bacterium]